MSIAIRYAHKSHIDELFIVGAGQAFYLGGKTIATFRKPIRGLNEVVLHEGHITIGGSFTSPEEVQKYVEKEFPDYTPRKVMVGRIVRNRWISPKLATKLSA